MRTTVPPPIAIGRYAVFGELAHGGMATLHIGKLLGAVGFSRLVAVKRLHPQYAHDPQFARMFLDEARLAARIHHPNVVPVLDVVYRENELFLVMDYIEGETLHYLAQVLKGRRQRVPIRILSAIMAGVLHGLHAAHEAKGADGDPLKIVHRDVSPQNIMVGTDGVARVLDFGIAKAAKRLQHTELGKFKGKISYMAPEQLMGEEVDRRVDVYAASVVLWEMLTGQKLFSAEEPGVAALAIVEGKVPKPSEKVAGGSKVFDEIVLKGLSHDPKERYQTARDMALAIEKAIPPAPASQVGDWVRSIAFEVIDQRAAIIAKVEKTEVDTPAVLGGSGAAARGNEPTVTFRIPTLNSASSGNADELARHLSPAPFRAHSPAAPAVSSQSDESEVSSKTDASPARPAHTDVVVPPDTASTEELRSDEPTDVPDDVKSDIFPPIADDLESPSATASTKESVSSGEFRLPAPFPGASLGASASATFDTLGSSADTANDVPTLPIHQGHRWLKAGLGVVAVLGIAAIVVVMTRSAKQPQEHVVSQPSTVANTTTSPIDTTKNDAGRTGDASQGKDVGVDSSTPDAASISTKVDAGKSTTSGTAPKPARYVLPLPTRKNSWPPKKPSKQSSGNDFENLTRK